MCVVKNCSRRLFTETHCKVHDPETQRIYRQKNLERFKGYKTKQLYGVSETEYAELLAKQGGGCGICGKATKQEASNCGGVKNLAVDHDHVTGFVRGLLCQNCNLGLGSFRESPELLRRAAAYLEEKALALEASKALADGVLAEMLQ